MIFMLLLLPFFFSASAHAQSSRHLSEAGKAISPVYEEMLANQMDELRRNSGRSHPQVLLAEDLNELTNLQITDQTFVFFFVLESDRQEVESRMFQRGFKLVLHLSLFELEHVKDRRGRQMVDLSRPEFMRKIFERLVREGMNPVHAHHASQQAVDEFRKLKEPKLLIFDRITS